MTRIVAAYRYRVALITQSPNENVLHYHRCKTPENTAMTDALFAPYLSQWQLQTDGDAIHTASATLLPVRWQGLPAMLKIAKHAEEEQGYSLLQWWQGQGAARVYARQGAALLMERATPARSLTTLSLTGDDDEAFRIACTVLTQLHTPKCAAINDAPPVTPLAQWFSALQAYQPTSANDVLTTAQQTMLFLLATLQAPQYLHGDIHHHNILDFGARGWLAIDPKGLQGERGFDYANLFCNPAPHICLDPQRFQARLAIVCATSAIPPQRMLQWILAWAGLSALWHLEDGGDASTALAVAYMARAALEA